MWTPDQITTLVVDLTALVGGIGAVLKMSHDTKTVSINAQNNAQNSVPSDLAHKMVDNAQTLATAAATATTNAATTLEVKPPADIEIKQTSAS